METATSEVTDGGKWTLERWEAGTAPAKEEEEGRGPPTPNFPTHAEWSLPEPHE